MAHTKKVIMPQSPDQETKQETPVIPQGDFQPSFGFDKHFKQPGDKPSLERSYEHWAQNRTPANLRKVVKAAEPVINTAVTSFAGGDTSLRSRAKSLAISGIKSYDPSRGTKLKTHLMIRMQPLQRHYLKRVTPIAVPERVQLDHYRLRQAEEAFKQTKGREASDDELAEMTGLSPRRIAHVRRLSKGVLAEGQTETAEEGVSTPGTQEITPEDVWIEYVHHDLDPIDKKILEWKTGLYGKERLGTSAIARRLGITPSAVSQRAAKIALMLERGKDNVNAPQA